MIKKSLLLALLASSTAFNTFGQTNEAFSFGVKTGLNGSVFTQDVEGLGTDRGSGFSDYKRFFRISAIIGFTADYNKNNRFSLGTELLYNARGMAYRVENNSVVIIGNDGAEQAYTYYKYNIDYLELPLKATYALSKEGNFKIYGGLAPAIAVNTVNATRYPEVNAGPGSSKPDVKKKLENVSIFNTSFITGFNIGWKNTSGIVFFADTRFSYTLLPVFTRDKNLNGENLNTRMTTGALGLGVKF